jgi:hypothetical protein
MSDLSRFVNEDVLPIEPHVIGFFCRDCVPEVTVSDWPADEVGLAPEGGWTSDVVAVLNTAHAPSCPSFTAFIAEHRTPFRFTFALDEGWENVLLRESVDRRPTSR